MNKIQAIYKLYPQVVRTVDDIAYDADDNVVEYDLQAVEAEAAQQQLNQESRSYLSSTDWYVIRQQETGVAIPQDILDARQAAREAIV
jgi:hypothetical protein